MGNAALGNTATCKFSLANSSSAYSSEPLTTDSEKQCAGLESARLKMQTVMLLRLHCPAAFGKGGGGAGGEERVEGRPTCLFDAGVRQLVTEFSGLLGVGGLCFDECKRGTKITDPSLWALQHPGLLFQVSVTLHEVY